jgi:hypothetical protein
MNFGLLKIVGIGILPAVVVGISMFVAHNVFIAMFVMHWSVMVLVPITLTVFNQGMAGLSWYKDYLRQQTPISDFRISVVLFLLGALVAFSAYALNSCHTIKWELCIGSVNSNVADYGFTDSPKWLIILCAVYFPLINPFIEEMFWRVYMDHEYILSVSDIDADHTSDEETSNLVEGQYLNSSENRPIKSTNTKDIPILVRLLFSSLYASYHTMVVGVFLGGIEYGILAFFLVTALGLVFQFIFASSNPRCALVRAVALHAGIDTGVVVALGDAIGWYSIVR